MYIYLTADTISPPPVDFEFSTELPIPPIVFSEFTAIDSVESFFSPSTLFLPLVSLANYSNEKAVCE